MSKKENVLVLLYFKAIIADSNYTCLSNCVSWVQEQRKLLLFKLGWFYSFYSVDIY